MRVAQIGQRLVRHHLRREGVIHRRQDLLLDLVQRHRVVGLLPRQLRSPEIPPETPPARSACRPASCPRSARKTSAGNFPAPDASQNFLPPCRFLLASGTISLIGTPSIAPVKSITAKSPIASPRSGTSMKSADLIAQPFQGGIDVRLVHFGAGQLHRNVFVVGQLELRRRHDRRAKTHRSIVAKFHIFQISQRDDAQLLLRDRLVITLRNQLLGQFVLDFLPELLLDHLPRRLAWRDNRGFGRIANSCSRSRPTPSRTSSGGNSIRNVAMHCAADFLLPLS